jgi:hypothetical protein
MGAVSPKTQLLAVDSIMQQHNDAIAALISAGITRHDRLLAPEDAIQLVISILEHVTMASYWLTLAAGFRKIPRDRPVRLDLSTAKSRGMRMAILQRIKSQCGVAFQVMDQLYDHADDKTGIKPHLESVNLQMLCVQINATLSAWKTATGGPPLSKNHLNYMVDQLEAVGDSAGFSERSRHDQTLLWSTRSLLGQALGDREMTRSALNECRLLVPKDEDDYPRLLSEIIAFAESDQERLESISELRTFATSANAGPLFSRERVGRMSVLRDTFWRAAIAVGPDDENAGELFDQCFGAYEEWLFGRTSPPKTNLIRLFTSWSGEGRAAWFSDGYLNIRRFVIDPEIAGALYIAMENAPQNTHRALREAIARLDTEVAPLLLEAMRDLTEPRILAVGQIGTLPVMATAINGRAIGCSPDIAYAHPNSGLTNHYDENVGPFELLLVDEAFAANAEKVKQALVSAASAKSKECRVLSFNSKSEATAVPAIEVIDALSAASTAVVFCHANSYVAQATRGGMVLGPHTYLTVEELASADISDIDQLVLMNCGSGRSNPFVGEVTLAHAAALAGAKEILFTLWPIRSNRGSRLVTEMVDARSAGGTFEEFVSRQFETDRFVASSIAIMRP